MTKKYFLSGGKIIAEYKEGEEGTQLVYRYGLKDVTGFSYGGKEYFYRKNLQGDITNIFDAEGNNVVEYLYDAWGTHSVIALGGTEEEKAANLMIGHLNPFRYRGYYFDEETDFYALPQRYYDPEVGRFINADDISYLDPESINGLNLYAYCLDNPVNNLDYNGNFVISLIVGLIIGGAVAGAIVGGTIAGITAYNNGARGWELFGWTMLGVVGGGIVGGAIGGLIGYALPAIGAGLAGFGIAGGSAAALTMTTAAVTTTTVALSGAILSGMAVGLVASLGYVLAKLPMHGTPNSKVSNDNSIGHYDENGNLVSRQDLKGKPHFIKELGDYYLPHTHKFTWKLVKGVWRFIEKILPF